MDETITDRARWERLATSPSDPIWGDRNVAIAKLIPPHSSVLDIGAGNRMLERLLVAADYQPMDCVSGCSKTILYDFNGTEEPPILSGFDVVVCSGVLEYIVDVQKFLTTVADYGKQVILTYAVLEHRTKAATHDPLINGWVNSFTTAELLEVFELCSIKVINTMEWNKHTIFELEKQD